MSVEKKNKGGRPTKYRSEYCDQVIQHMAAGFSFESFAAVVGVWKDALYRWAEDYEEFSNAKKTGFEASRLFWERVGIEHVVGTSESSSGVGSSSRSLNATVYIFNMKNRFPEEWRDKQEVAHSGTVSIEQTNFNIKRRK